MTHVLMRATIWAAVTLFVAAQLGHRARAERARGGGWPSRAFAAGAVLLGVHMAMAMAWTHAWSHTAALADTARVTASVYGVAWSGGLYANYAFLALWVAEAVWWWRSPAGYASRSRGLTWTIRALFAVILVNATVVFTRGPSQVLGLVLMLALLWAWRPSRGPMRT